MTLAEVPALREPRQNSSKSASKQKKESVPHIKKRVNESAVVIVINNRNKTQQYSSVSENNNTNDDDGAPAKQKRKKRRCGMCSMTGYKGSGGRSYCEQSGAQIKHNFPNGIVLPLKQRQCKLCKKYDKFYGVEVGTRIRVSIFN